MHGTIASKIRGESPGGFIARISILGRKPANMISFLKALNCIRADNMNSTQDSFHTSESLVKDIKRMIQRDNEAACVGLVQLGAAVNVNTVVKPRVDLGTYYHHETAGQSDGLTLTCAYLPGHPPRHPHQPHHRGHKVCPHLPLHARLVFHG